MSYPIKAWASQAALMVTNPPANAGDARDTGSVPGLGISNRGGHGNQLQYSCPKNPMVRGAWCHTPQGRKELDMTEVTGHTHKSLGKVRGYF